MTALKVMTDERYYVWMNDSRKMIKEQTYGLKVSVQ